MSSYPKDLDEMKRLLDSRFNEVQMRAIAADERSKAAEERATAADERAKAAEERAKAAEERATAAEERAKAASERVTAAEESSKAAEERSIAVADVQERLIQNLKNQFEVSSDIMLDIIVNDNQDDAVNNATTSGLKRRIIFDAAPLASCLFRLIFSVLLYPYIDTVLVYSQASVWAWISVAMMVLSLISEMQVEQFQGEALRATYLLYLPAFILILIHMYQDFGWAMVALAQALHMIQLALRQEKPKVLILSYLVAAISSIFIATQHEILFHALYLYPLHALLYCWGLPVCQQVEEENRNVGSTDTKQQTENTQNTQCNSDETQDDIADDVENNQLDVKDNRNEGIHQSNRSLPAGERKISHATSYRSTAQWNILKGYNTDKRNEGLDYDTYSFMMLSEVSRTISFRHKSTMVVIACPSISWITGMFTFIIQLGLGLLIILDQWDKPTYETNWNIPMRNTLVVSTGQFLSVIAALMTQTDILVPIKVLNRLWYEKGEEGKDLEWKNFIGEDSTASLSLWLFRILLPNILKMLQGIAILTTSFIIIIQSDDIVELFKDFTALFVISSLDNIIFMAADNEFLGKVLSEKVDEVKSKKLKKEKHTISVWLNVTFVFMMLGMLGGWIYVRIGQSSGRYMMQKYPDCNVDYQSWIGNGRCSGGDYNTEECGWDGGDCIVDKYPDCHVDKPEWIGDGRCSGGDYNTEECGWDGGDCIDCHVDVPEWIGDGGCSGGAYNTEECGWDGGDCIVDKYPDCHVDKPEWIGDGGCSGGAYNTEECGWDGGDCIVDKYPDCHVGWPLNIGNGWCSGGAYNTEECGWDGGDCDKFNEKYPDCHVDKPEWIGDGLCDGGAYNTEECGWDGGDCL